MAQPYLNPVELLGLPSIPPEHLGSAIVKKARRLLAALHLSDGYYSYLGQRVDRR